MTIAKAIDQTLLKPDATEADIISLCEEAKLYGFMSVCIAPCHVPLARDILKGSGVRTCTVIGFPPGFQSAAVKSFETNDAVRAGAEEVDAVINIGYLRSGRTDILKEEISGIVKSAGGAIVKIIIETCYLTDEEKILAASLVKEGGADFVKTSTGFGSGGATVEDISLIVKNVPGIKVKASGGIRTFEDAKKMLDAGASRIGTSAGPAIVRGMPSYNNR